MKPDPAAPRVRQKCKFGDPFCPCQDGDQCHYKGDNPWPAPSKKQIAHWNATARVERCWPWSHKWTRWATFSEGRLARTIDALGLPVHEPLQQPIIVGFYEEQKRICEKCGMSQLRETRT